MLLVAMLCADMLRKIVCGTSMVKRVSTERRGLLLKKITYKRSTDSNASHDHI